jgi:hypothetical protein
MITRRETGAKLRNAALQWLEVSSCIVQVRPLKSGTVGPDRDSTPIFSVARVIKVYHDSKMSAHVIFTSQRILLAEGYAYLQLS